jgi:hypothetical protein
MSKTVKCPVKHFKGTVSLCEPLTMPQVIAIDKSVVLRGEYFEERGEGDKRGYYLKPDTAWSSPDNEALKAILECVDEWHLDNVPEDVTLATFPGSPRQASKDLISWLWGEVLDVYKGDVEIPNE